MAVVIDQLEPLIKLFNEGQQKNLRRWLEEHVDQEFLLTQVSDNPFSTPDGISQSTWTLGAESPTHPGAKVFAIIDDDEAGVVHVYAVAIVPVEGDTENAAVQIFRDRVWQPHSDSAQGSLDALYDELADLIGSDEPPAAPAPNGGGTKKHPAAVST